MPLMKRACALDHAAQRREATEYERAREREGRVGSKVNEESQSRGNKKKSFDRLHAPLRQPPEPLTPAPDDAGWSRDYKTSNRDYLP